MAVGKNDNKVSAKVFSCLSFIAAAVLLVLGIAGWTMGSSVVSTVNKGLVDQKIYFPPSGNPAFSAALFPKAQTYADKQVTNGSLAKAYADDFLGVQIKLVGNGKTTSEVSAMLAADPQNPALQQQQAAMFQLDTSKTLMLVSGYGTWSQGMMMKNLGALSLAATVVLLLVGSVQRMRYKKG